MVNRAPTATAGTLLFSHPYQRHELSAMSGALPLDSPPSYLPLGPIVWKSTPKAVGDASHPAAHLNALSSKAPKAGPATALDAACTPMEQQHQ